MIGNRDLFLENVIHNTFVSVDEAGTEAAAAAAVVMLIAIPPKEPVKVTVNHPFIFLIHDIATGTILSVGRTLNPIA